MSTLWALLMIVLPVFLLVGSGYAAVRLRIFADAGVDALVGFASGIAVPALLFRAIYRLDLAGALRLDHLLAFYAGAVLCFAGATLLSRHVWKRRPGEAVAAGFPALFSNSVLLGLPIAERAFGASGLEPVFAIIAFHAAFCYLVGIVTMELARRDGAPLGTALVRSGRAMFRNALTIGIALGFAFNLMAIRLPEPVLHTLDLLVSAALPVALFGLGGVLTRYALRSGLGEALMVAGFSLLVHPAIVWVLAVPVLALPAPFAHAAVLIAAMPPGINAYLFAALYGRSVGVAASTVILATGLSLPTITFWLWVLGGEALG